MAVTLKASRKFHSSYFNVDAVISDYLEWVSSVFYVIVYRFNFNTGEPEYGCFRSPKRGDDLYSSRVMFKFKCLGKSLDDSVFFKRNARDKWVKSSCLHIVLEYDANRFGIRESYDLCGVDFNRYMSHLRRNFGKCSIVRCFESHESGYCHIHLMVQFSDYYFNGKPMINSKGKRVFRVVGEDWKTLKKGWSRGYSNIEMVDSPKGGVYYLSKYLSKSVSVKEAGEKGVKGLAMCWFTRKRSFSVSGGFIRNYLIVNILLLARRKRFNLDGKRLHIMTVKTLRLLRDEILAKSNSTEGVYSHKVGVDLDGKTIELRVTTWKFHGFMPSDHVIWRENFRIVKGNQFEKVEGSNNVYEWVGDRKKVELGVGQSFLR